MCMATVQATVQAMSRAGDIAPVLCSTSNGSDSSSTDNNGTVSVESGQGHACNNGTEVASGAAVDKQRQLWLSPVPQWNTAKDVWGVAWPLHTYIYATVFLGLFVISVIMLWKAVARRKASKRQPTGKLNGRSSGLLPPPVLTLLTLATLLRAVLLYVDPYNSQKRFPTVAARTLGNLPFTCMIAAYQLLFLALRSSLKIKLGSLHWLQNRVRIFLVVASFMAFNTLVDIILVLAVKSRTLLLICMLANVAWLSVISVEYLVIMFRLYRRIHQTPMASPLRGDMADGDEYLLKQRGNSVSFAPEPATSGRRSLSEEVGRERSPSKLSTLGRRFTQSSLVNKEDGGGKANRPQFQKRVINMLLCLLLSSSVYLAFLFYYMLGVADAINFTELIDPWTWFSVATCHRLSEVAAVSVILVTMSLASGQKQRSSVSSRSDSWQLNSISLTTSQSRAVFVTVDAASAAAAGNATKLSQSLKSPVAAVPMPAILQPEYTPATGPSWMMFESAL